MLYSPMKIDQLEVIKDHVIVSDMEFGSRTVGGVILRDDDMKPEGIRARWGKVYAIGPEQKNVKVGEWVLVSHARWGRGLDIEDEFGNNVTIRRVDCKDIIMASDEKPADDYVGRLFSPSNY